MPMIEFSRPNGGTTKGYQSLAGEGRPGVIVIQEWWGLNDQMCGIADRFARAGYNALAPDLYEGRVTQEPDEANHMMSGLDFPGATHEDIRGAAQHLLGSSSAVAAMGFCMGGALTIAAAVHLPEVAAAVCYYGIPPAEFAAPGDVRVPMQCHFANEDDWCTPTAVDELEAALAAAGADYEIHRYDAKHAFCNEQSVDAYDAASANLSWQRMMDFLEAKL
ncbi:MAG TPA: dienelactone hydrolase family protein [Alphaproteobacteria bacterium]|jgi:carboxymethylenebutenolidase|nr:dienelactone hydrolase family protein [Alphaproteobacteria bacterium]MDP6270402.1 dienelactone hydrolase family protein [Alphaproteobacteria bacterium]HJM51460.1 dienelactone hydrolase family protein [Alphaproteobacteria bacterium]